MLMALASVFSACEMETSWPVGEKSYETIAVEATITGEFKKHHILVTRPASVANAEFEPASGAWVTVGDGYDFVEFMETEDEPGLYESQAAFAAVIDRQYRLAVYYRGKTYEASAYMIPVYPSTRLQTGPVGDVSGMFEIKWIAVEYSPQEQAMYEVVIDWSHLPVYNHPDSVSRAKIMHYTLKTIDVSYNIFPQDKEEIVFPPGSIITEKKYSVNDHFAAYLRALLAETEWQGSLFEEARGNLPTNISNGGLGYFSVCAVLTDTLVAH